MAEKPRIARRDRLTVLDRGNRIEVQHVAPQTGSSDWGYDWSCIQITPSEAEWLAKKLLKWVESNKKEHTTKESRRLS